MLIKKFDIFWGKIKSFSSYLRIFVEYMDTKQQFQVDGV